MEGEKDEKSAKSRPRVYSNGLTKRREKKRSKLTNGAAIRFASPPRIASFLRYVGRSHVRERKRL